MATPGIATPIDEAKLNEFMGKAVGDMGAAMHAVLVLLGDRLGLYKGMADSQPVTPAELAARTGTHERYVREWLNANAASGYVTYNAVDGKYTLPPEQAFALAVDNSPAYLPGSVSDHFGLFSRLRGRSKKRSNRARASVGMSTTTIFITARSDSSGPTTVPI